MRRFSVIARMLLVALAMFQAGAPAIASIADSSVASRTAAPSHIEDHTRRNCAPVHPDDCALCRVLSIASQPAGRAVGLACVALRIAVVRDRFDAAPAAIARSLQRSRAPPTA